jgi:hypothetical protein
MILELFYSVYLISTGYFLSMNSPTVFRTLLRTVFLLFFFCLHHVSSADVDPLEMTLWAVPNDLQEWTSTPTWHQETTIENEGLELDYLGVLDIAHRHYAWVNTQPNAFKATSSACLVAAMWDPVSRIVYASTVPRGPRKAQMTKATVQDNAAPLLASQLQPMLAPLQNQDYTSGQWRNAFFHAEDGVYFNWETVGNSPVSGQYPPGSIIAVWGKFQNMAIDDSIQLCSTKRNPSCQSVADGLGVLRFGTLPPSPPTQPPPPPSADDDSDAYSEGPTDEQFLAAEAACLAGMGPNRKLAIRGQGPWLGDSPPPSRRASNLPSRRLLRQLLCR